MLLNFMIFFISDYVIFLLALFGLATSVSCFSFLMHITTDDEVLDDVLDNILDNIR